MVRPILFLFRSVSKSRHSATFLRSAPIASGLKILRGEALCQPNRMDEGDEKKRTEIMAEAEISVRFQS